MSLTFTTVVSLLSDQAIAATQTANGHCPTCNNTMHVLRWTTGYQRICETCGWESHRTVTEAQA